MLLTYCNGTPTHTFLTGKVKELHDVEEIIAITYPAPFPFETKVAGLAPWADTIVILLLLTQFIEDPNGISLTVYMALVEQIFDGPER